LYGASPNTGSVSLPASLMQQLMPPKLEHARVLGSVSAGKFVLIQGINEENLIELHRKEGRPT
jgi:hypothetical protein